MKSFHERVERERRPVPECPDCDGTDSRIDYRPQTFRHGRGDDEVELNCEVPVYICNHCGYEWTGSEAEDARQVAVCRHLGRITPDEVRRIREQSGLSQAQFSKITGFGEASLSRWETGAQVQNASSDRLLRLLIADARNLQRLERIAEATNVPVQSTFKVLAITPEIRRRQGSFRLQRAS
jgi:putative zinc finger/helix-turn-helix YgiT family protein